MKVGIYKRGCVWWARWREDGVQRRVNFRTENRKVAEEKRIRLENRLLNGEGVQGESRAPMAELVEVTTCGRWRTSARGQ